MARSCGDAEMSAEARRTEYRRQRYDGGRNLASRKGALATHGLLDLAAPGGLVVHADSFIHLLFGSTDLPYGALIGSFAERVGPWSSLTVEEREGIRSGDPATRTRVIEAMGRSLRLLAEDRLRHG